MTSPGVQGRGPASASPQASKGLQQQLDRLQPLVGVPSLAVVQRSNHGPWRVTLMYRGELTEAVVEQARQGRVLRHRCSAMAGAPRVLQAIARIKLVVLCNRDRVPLAGCILDCQPSLTTHLPPLVPQHLPPGMVRHSKPCL